MGERKMQTEQRYTYKDLLTWPENERWELIHGVPFQLDGPQMAAPTTAHQDWVGEAFHQFKTQLKGKPCKPYVAPVDVSLLHRAGDSDETTDTVVQPDVLVVCRPEQDNGKGIAGAPVFVLEVQSASTGFRDQTDKLKLYEEAGVAEYFIFNPVNYALWAYRQGANGRYGKPEVWVERSVVELVSLPGVSLDFTVAV